MLRKTAKYQIYTTKSVEKTKLDVARYMHGISSSEIHEATLDFSLPEAYLEGLIHAGFSKEQAQEIVDLESVQQSKALKDRNKTVEEIQLSMRKEMELSIQRMIDSSAYDIPPSKDANKTLEEAERLSMQTLKEIQLSVQTLMIDSSAYDIYDPQSGASGAKVIKMKTASSCVCS